jgi:hypothetical protein
MGHSLPELYMRSRLQTTFRTVKVLRSPAQRTAGSTLLRLLRSLFGKKLSKPTKPQRDCRQMTAAEESAIG